MSPQPHTEKITSGTVPSGMRLELYKTLDGQGWPTGIESGAEVVSDA